MPSSNEAAAAWLVECLADRCIAVALGRYGGSPVRRTVDVEVVTVRASPTTRGYGDQARRDERVSDEARRRPMAAIGGRPLYRVGPDPRRWCIAGSPPVVTP